MIVISHPIFLETVQPYVDWKNQKGIPTELYDVTTIGTTEEDIRNFVTDEYNSPEGLTFVQLVGDFPLVPTYLTDIIFFEIHGVSDATYELVEGADTYPDLFVGRFSAETITTLETQIDRTIWYEKEIAGGDWLHKGCGLATVWGHLLQLGYSLSGHQVKAY